MIGKLLKYVRLKNNLSQENLSKLLNIKQNTLSRYETNNADPSFATIEKIVKICGYQIYFENENEKITVQDLSRKDI